MATYLIGRNVTYNQWHKKYSPCGLPIGKKYRSHFEIIALILEAAKNRGEGRFAIMKYASVNCTQLEKFLHSLVDIGFIEVESMQGRSICRATEKGLAFLRQYYVLLGMLIDSHPEGNLPAMIIEAPTGR
jgi:predicted transcriptional regulator